MCFTRNWASTFLDLVRCRFKDGGCPFLLRSRGLELCVNGVVRDDRVGGGGLHADAYTLIHSLPSPFRLT